MNQLAQNMQGKKQICFKTKSEGKDKVICCDLEDFTNKYPTERTSIFINSYQGLGDNVYMRPFAMKYLEKYDLVYFKTGFPEIITEGTPLRAVKPNYILKSFKDTIAGNNFYAPSITTQQIKLDYQKSLRNNIGIIQGMADQTGMQEFDFELPVSKEWQADVYNKLNIKTDKKICVLKLPTIRKEFPAHGRNGKMEYFDKIIQKYKDEFYFVSVADCRGEENFDGELPQSIDLHLNYGELNIKEYTAIFKLADCVVGAVGNIIPVSLAVKTPLFVIYGGHVPNNLLVDERMGLDKYGYVEPDNFCFCNDIRHDCKKDIPEDKLIGAFEEWKNRAFASDYKNKWGRFKNNNLLVSRLRGFRVDKIKNNQYIKDYFCKVVGIDHNKPEDYLKYNIKYYRYGVEKDAENLVKEVIDKEAITHCIIAQKLHTLADATYRACIAKGVKIIWSEVFFDDKLLYDYNGLQYTPDNDIVRFAEKHKGTKIELPRSTRQPQKDELINLEDFKTKYDLGDRDNLVLFGQVVWDMSLKNSICQGINTYEDFLKAVIELNPNTNIIIKPHPQCTAEKYKFVYDYKNVRVTEENINSFWNCFDRFITFSSTTSFEAVVRNKKIAVCGHTLVPSDSLVLQIKERAEFSNLYAKLGQFEIDPKQRNKHLSFLTTKYALAYNSKALLEKIILADKEFYA